MKVCFIISEVVQFSALSACAEHKTLFMRQIWPDGVFTPTYLSYAFPDLVCARRGRDDITLVAHTSSGRSLLLEGRNITIVFLAQHSVAYSAVTVPVPLRFSTLAIVSIQLETAGNSPSRLRSAFSMNSSRLIPSDSSCSVHGASSSSIPLLSRASHMRS